jgi:hypothetical protein
LSPDPGIRRQSEEFEGESLDAVWGEWFDLVNRKNELFRTEMQLYHTRRMQELEDKHSEVELEIRILSNIPQVSSMIRRTLHGQ